MQMVNFYCCSILQNLCFLQGHHGGFYPATMVKEKKTGKAFSIWHALVRFWAGSLWADYKFAASFFHSKGDAEGNFLFTIGSSVMSL